MPHINYGYSVDNAILKVMRDDVDAKVLDEHELPEELLKLHSTGSHAVGSVDLQANQLISSLLGICTRNERRAFAGFHSTIVTTITPYRAQ